MVVDRLLPHQMNHSEFDNTEGLYIYTPDANHGSMQNATTSSNGPHTQKTQVLFLLMSENNCEDIFPALYVPRRTNITTHAAARQPQHTRYYTDSTASRDPDTAAA
jgi:hypothetical protein